MNATGKKKFQIGTFFTKWTSVLATVFIFVLFSVMMPGTFPSMSNIVTILRSVSITTVIAIGLTIAMSAGGFDLSAGALATVAGTFIISFFVWYNMSMWLALPLAFVCTLALTGVTLVLVLKFHVPDLLATMAMMFMLQGLSLTYAGGGAITPGMTRRNGEISSGEIPAAFKALGQAPWIILIMLLSVVVVHIMLNYTKYGRYIYAVGNNREAARLSGIPVTRYRIVAWLLAGAFITLGGLLVASRNNAATMSAADGQMMPAIAAVVIGNSVAGAGKPNAIGTFVGAVLVGILENGLVMLSVPYYALNVIKGLVLAVALASAYIHTKE